MSFVYDPALLRVSGPDCAGFLDNLLTRDVSSLAAGEVAYAGLLTPQGKVIADVFVWRDFDDSFLLEAAASRLAALAQKLRLYRLRARITIEDASGTLRGVLQFGVRTRQEGRAEKAGLVAADPRPPVHMERALVAPDLVGLIAGEHTPSLGAADVRARRIAEGHPDVAEECGPEEVFALEALFEEMGGVDFHKGCFVGQENVSRMKRRATTRRKLCRIGFTGEPPEPGAAILAGAAPIGDVRSAGPVAQGGGWGIALLRLDRARAALDQGGELTVGGRAIQFAPPAWMLLPPVGENEGSGSAQAPKDLSSGPA
jgi:folate-binding protein YgfZ